MHLLPSSADTASSASHTSELKSTLMTLTGGGWLTLRAVGENYFSNYKMCLAQRLSAPLCADGIAPGQLRPGFSLK